MRALPKVSRRSWISLGVVVALLLIYTLAGFFGVPWLARSLLTTQVEQKMQRRLALGDIHFNPYTLQARIQGFALSEADGAPLIAFRELLVDAELASLWQRAIHLKQVRLSEPDIAVVIEADGSVNLAKLAPPAEQAPAEAAAPPKILIDLLSVEDGRLAFEDRSRTQPFSTTLQPIRFSLADFGTASGHENAYEFSGSTAAGEQLQWSGDFSLQPLASSGKFSVQGLQAQTVGSYLQQQLPFALAGGVADFNGSYQLGFDPALSLDLQLPQVVLNQLALAERAAPTAKPPLSLTQLRLLQLGVSLQKRELSIERIELDAPRASVLREADGGLNLSRLFAASPPAPAPTPAAAETPWRISAGTLQLKDGAFSVEDRAVTPAARFELAPVDVTVSGYSSAADARLQLQATATIAGKSRLQADGEVQLQPLAAKLNLDLAGFALDSLQPYVSQATTLQLRAGTLEVKGALDYAAPPQGAAQLGFKGNLAVEELHTMDSRLGQDLLRWGRLDVTGIDYRQTPQELSIDSIALRSPYARVAIAKDRTLNFADVMKPSPAKPAGEKSAPLKLLIKTVSVQSGVADFSDRSIQPAFATGIVELRGSVTGLSSEPGARAKVKLQGDVDRYSPVLIEGTVNPFAAAQYTDLALSFRNMELTTFNPYSGKFAGYNITKGKLTTELKYKIKDRQLQAEHHVSIDNLEFGEATGSKQAVPVPIKLAVALLKDRHGVIDLDLPVRGSLDDPTFKIGPVVWKAVTGLLSRIVTAPFSALGALFGGGTDQELAWLDFAPGSAELDSAAIGKLDKLGKALASRPQLKLDVPLTASIDADRPVLARSALAQRVPKINPAGGLTPEKAEKERLGSLERAYKDLVDEKPRYPEPKEDTDKAARTRERIAWLEQALSTKLAPTAETVDLLGRSRAQAVRAALLANPEISAERIFIVGGQANVGVAGAVRMELKLK